MIMYGRRGMKAHEKLKVMAQRQSLYPKQESQMAGLVLLGTREQVLNIGNVVCLFVYGFVLEYTIIAGH